MNHVDRTDIVADDELNSPLLQQLRDEFEGLSRTGANSRQRPSVAHYLERCPARERARLRSVLEKIEKTYLERSPELGGGDAAQTIEFGVAPQDSPELAPATVDFLAGKTDPDMTLDSPLTPPKGFKAVSADGTDPDITIDPVSGGADGFKLGPGPGAGPDQTMDVSPSQYAPTVDPDGCENAPSSDSISEDQAYVAGHEILAELGRGGMGVVYKARQVKLNRMVALKMVLAGAHAAPEQLARFQTEAEAVARLKHPNIVQIYDVGEHEGLPYFSLEYVDGGTLQGRIGGKPQPPREAAHVVERLADAMSSAHRHDIIHRDLKPANVLLTTDGDPKITDFGLAKRLEEDSSQTRSGTIMGTPSYMAPEQARGDSKNIGPKSDQYALGAILYEMLTGRPPFQGTTILETLEQVQKQEPVPPCRLQPRVPRDLETVCLKCLQKEPEKRYPTTSALAADLMRFLGGETIMARPVGQFEKGWRWCRRNPRVAVLTTAVIVLLATAGSSFSVLAARDARERREAAERHAHEQKTIEDLSSRTGQRIEQATEAIQLGAFARAADLLHRVDEPLEAEELADLRGQVRTLREQIALYVEFQRMLDSARYAALFGGPAMAEQARDYCQQLVQLYDEIENHTGRGAVGLPPLSPKHQELFQEDAFEAFLIGAWVENNAAARTSAETQRSALRGVQWLNRAEKLMPPTKVLFAHRSAYEGAISEVAASAADQKRAHAIAPTSAIDHFWHGFSEHLRASEAQKAGDPRGQQEHLHIATGEYAALLQERPEHFWAYFDWANCQFQLQNFDDAIVGYTACIHLKPDAPWPYNNRGTSHQKLKQYELAIQDYTLALQRDPKSIDTYLSQAEAHLGMGAQEAAFNDFSQAIALSPERAASYHRRAEARRQLKQYPEALEDYDQALQRNAQFVEAYLGRALILLEQKKLEQALNSLDHAIQANPKHFAALVQRANLRRQLMRLPEARADYDQALAIRPNDVQTYLQRAQLLQQMKLPDKALDDYNRIIEFRPDESKAYSGRGYIHFARGQYAKARDDFSSAFRLAAADPAVLRVRGALNLAYLRDLDAALEDWSKLAQMQPNNAEAIFRVAVIELGRKRYEDALEHLKKAQQLDPKYLEIYWAQAQIHMWRGDLEPALRVVNITLNQSPPTKPEGLNVRGDIYRAMGRLSDAAADYKQLIELKPTLPDAYISLAGLFEKQGDVDQAIRCYDQMVKKVQTARGFLRRAEFRRKRGDAAGAIADCDEAAKLDPKLAEVDLVRASIEAKSGRPHQAVADAERILAAAPVRDGHLLYAAACVLSLASQAAAADPENPYEMQRSRLYAERAVALLTETLDRGFHDLIYPEHNRMVEDPALAPIRDDARKLLTHRP